MKLTPSERGKLGAIKSKERNEFLLRERLNQYAASPAVCLTCNSALSYKKRHEKFCNRSCSAKTNNVGVNRHYNNQTNEDLNVFKGSNPPSISLHKCLFCMENDTKRKYCSLSCANMHKDETRKLEFSLGNVSSKTAKRFLIDIHGNKCMECGWGRIHPITGKCPIEIEHIDGNSKNNMPDNLKLICPNCHSLTLTYKALNKGNGRHERMNRYNTGKSY